MDSATVLVVDDDEAIVAFLEMALTDLGYRVLSAVDGEALQVAHAAQPSIILLDIMMPGMDGIEVSRRLRGDPATSSIPIIAMSAQERLDASGAFLQVDATLPKPFELDHLYALVARWGGQA